MWTLLMSAFGLSLDSFVVCLALGPLTTSRICRYRLAGLFGTCDAMATLLSAAFGITLPDWVKSLSPALVASYGLCVLLLSRVSAWNPRAIYLLPIALALDNLVAGLPLHAVAVVGVVSGLTALIGLTIGTTVAPGRRIPRERLAGAAIIISACLMWIS